MAPERLQVDAILYPCATAIEAQPGDRLMVVAGVVVGVYTGRLPASLAVPSRALAEAKPPEAAPKAQQGGARKRRLVRRHEDARAAREAMRQHLLDALRRSGGRLDSKMMTAQVPGYDVRGRGNADFRRIVAELERDGILAPSDRRGAHGFRSYVLQNDPATQDA